MPPLFESSEFTVRALRKDEVPTLQALYEANPDYFVTVGGQPPAPHEAQRQFDELPPAHLGHATRWFAGVFDRQGTLKGLVIVVSDLMAPGIWHIALFFLASPLRGTGAAQALHSALEAWARASGACWLRLGVVDGNHRARRFWILCGYTAVRTRPLVNASGETTTTTLMVKPLAARGLDDYLQLAPRDAPGSTLP